MPAELCEPCILDVTASMGEPLPPAALPAARRDAIANDRPPKGYVPPPPRFRPAWLIDAYFATKPGTVAAVNALAALAEGVESWRSPADANAQDAEFEFDSRHATAARFLQRSGRRGRRAIVADDPTPEEIRRECEAIQAGWTPEQFAMRASGNSMKGRKVQREELASAG